ncbi:MAG: polyribonucleotide nucleotidyltransferase [Patescibacteria group bacterium]
MSYPTYGNTFKKEIKIADKTVQVEIGKFSEQVAAAVMVTAGETVVHTTVALGRQVELGYFPLSVEFAEKLYAGGIIKGSRWVKRDGRPTDDAILKARVIDRSIRPRFPDGMKHEVQVISTVFSYDGENDADMLGLIGTTIALSVSQIPFEGPMAGIRVGYNQETQALLINPTNTERKTSSLDMIVSGTGETIIMVEAGANEVSEPVMIEALTHSQTVLGEICSQINEIVAQAGKEKVQLVVEPAAEVAAAAETLSQTVSSKYAAEIHEMVKKEGVLQPTGIEEVIEKIVTDLNADKAEDAADLVTAKQIGSLLHELMKAEARRMILKDGVRPDGRKTDEIRPIWCEIDVFPRTHGSAMFKRGATQAVTITTLGSPSLGQHIEDMEGEEVRHYMHHYNMPPYASGEAGRFGYPKRREIGHGALAERALLPMIPSQEEFPYTIHVVSEIMSSNGSTSQASVCGSTLSLMAAGVPIKKPVAGIAMGLMSDGEKYVVLSDIQGLEDHVGDMDFKVAGTDAGITAIQMDIKLKGIPLEVLTQALEQARVGRLHIMGKMMACISAPKASISQYAPKIKQIIIPADKIGEVIGTGGKIIKQIVEESGAEVSVEEDEEKHVGMVNISSPDQEKIDKAMSMIDAIVREVAEGDEFDGVVTRVESYGAFVEYLPNREGLVHVSAMAPGFVAHAEDIVKLGDQVHVRISEIKPDGKIGLSMLTPEQEAQMKSERAERGERQGSNGGNGGRGGFSGRGVRGGFGSRDRGGDRGDRRGGFRRDR